MVEIIDMVGIKISDWGGIVLVGCISIPDLVNLGRLDASMIGEFKYMSSSQMEASRVTGRWIKVKVCEMVASGRVQMLRCDQSTGLLIPT
jgi:hypothetical protein